MSLSQVSEGKPASLSLRTTCSSLMVFTLLLLTELKWKPSTPKLRLPSMLRQFYTRFGICLEPPGSLWSLNQLMPFMTWHLGTYKTVNCTLAFLNCICINSCRQLWINSLYLDSTCFPLVLCHLGYTVPHSLTHSKWPKPFLGFEAFYWVRSTLMV
jgi:hypothetical protein